jgi:uncharacterized protein (DUF2225 family)
MVVFTPSDKTWTCAVCGHKASCSSLRGISFQLKSLSVDKEIERAENIFGDLTDVNICLVCHLKTLGLKPIS